MKKRRMCIFSGKLLLILALLLGQFNSGLPLIAYATFQVDSEVTLKPEVEEGTEESAPKPEVEEGTEESTPEPEVEEGTEEVTPEPEVEEETEEVTPEPEVEEETEEVTPEPEVEEGTEEVVPEPEVEEETEEVTPEPEVEEGTEEVTPELIEFLCYGDCRNTVHTIYEDASEDARILTTFSNVYAKDAVFLDETEDFYKIYMAGEEGWVKKVDEQDGEFLTAEPRYLNKTQTIQSYNADIIFVEDYIALDEYLVQEPLEFQKYTQNKSISEAVNESQQIKPVVTPSNNYIVSNAELKHCFALDLKDTKKVCTNISSKPKGLSDGEYYSYDGKYFYKNIEDIKPNGQGAVNEKQPHYNYFQYLPFRSVTNYQTNDFVEYLANEKGYTDTFTEAEKASLVQLSRTPKYNAYGIDYSKTNEIILKACISKTKCTPAGDNRSMLLEEIDEYKVFESAQGANALTEFSFATHESGFGTSPISIAKNNFYGMQAYDAEPLTSALTAVNEKTGLQVHIDDFIYNYSHPEDYRYRGAHLGNKTSGMNVKYASDPLWGQKIANHISNLDKAMGGQDNGYYTVGIIEDTANLVVRGSASNSGAYLYDASYVESDGVKRWIQDYPVLIVGEVGDWYKIKTDIPLTMNGDKVVRPDKTAYGVQYDYFNEENITYGYIPKSRVNHIIGSNEYNDPKELLENKSGYEDFVTRFYEIVHNRKPDTNGLNYWVDKLMTNAIGPGDLVRHFVNSPEFKSKNYTNKEFVIKMYELLQHRTPDAEGLNYWMNKLEKGLTWDYIIVGFVNSSEYKDICASYGINHQTIRFSNVLDSNESITEFVYNFYISGHNRKPDYDGHVYWVNQLASKNVSAYSFAVRILFSDEMNNRNLSNEEFVNRVYKTVLMRTPESSGKVYWIKQLEQGLSRNDLVVRFTQESEYINLCEAIGIKVK